MAGRLSGWLWFNAIYTRLLARLDWLWEVNQGSSLVWVTLKTLKEEVNFPSRDVQHQREVQRLLVSLYGLLALQLCLYLYRSETKQCVRLFVDKGYVIIHICWTRREWKSSTVRTLSSLLGLQNGRLQFHMFCDDQGNTGVNRTIVRRSDTCKFCKILFTGLIVAERHIQIYHALHIHLGDCNQVEENWCIQEH